MMGEERRSEERRTTPAAEPADAALDARIAALEEYARCLAEQNTALAHLDMAAVDRLAHRRDTLQSTMDALAPLTRSDARSHPEAIARVQQILRQCNRHQTELQQRLRAARLASLDRLRHEQGRRDSVVAYLRNGLGAVHHFDRRL